MSTDSGKELENVDLSKGGAAETFGGKSEFRLHDIEQQLEMAESRCNNLKDQLDSMKKMYGGAHRTRKVSTIKCSSAGASSIVALEDSSTNTEAVPNRQKSNHIGTDDTGAVVRTINNILNGITNSVNRISGVRSRTTTPRVQISTGTGDRNEQEAKTVEVIPELKIESTGTLTTKGKSQKRKARSGKTVSQHTIKKPSRVEKRGRSVVASLEKKSSSAIKKLNSKNPNLVEIYHNDAVKHSDSDESNLKKSRQKEDIPPLTIQEQEQKSEYTYAVGCPKSPYDPPDAPRTTVSCVYSKNYELPTVASRMKQVAKSYLGTLNLKTIPFCAAISTTQSHNIGINIQQVMNIIKNRQPINGISPTLAHNIGLAAEKLNNKPFSALVSTINSRISQTASRCPLSRTYFNMQQLQEQAKVIPEETIEEGDEETGESPVTQTMIITGPSGDMEIKTKALPNWRDDKSNSTERCTCVGFQQIANRYQRNIRTITENSLNSQITEKKQRLNRYTQPIQKGQTLKGREKTLKEVLASLHDDFESLNRRYEDLSQKSQGEGNNETTIKELERLELELTKKEEEITMVMTLYKEVLALKQQVKQLKEKRSQSSLISRELQESKSKFKEYKNPEAAFHLTKLLRQIQHYQMRYKSNLSQE